MNLTDKDRTALYGQAKNRDLVKKALAAPVTPVLVYQMGKVASMTIVKSLKQIPGQMVFHVHNLNPENIDGAREIYIEKGYTVPEVLFTNYLNIYHSLIRSTRKLKIISMVREPISRNVSGFFHNLDTILKKECAYLTEINRLKDAFLKNYTHTGPITWFEDEFNPVLGIDIYRHPFNVEKKYSRISTPRFDILVFRCDLADSVKERVIGELLGNPDFELLPGQNLAGGKEYSAVYHEFLRSVRFPGNFLDMMLNNKYTRHFFSDAEIRQIRKQWERV